MKLKTITWKLRDPREVYADIPNIKATDLKKTTCPEDLYNQFKFLFENETVEKFVVFWLATNNKVTGFEIISTGSLNGCIVSPREVFRGAIVNNCANIIVAHNHPSGNLDVSNEDISITKKIKQTGEIIGVELFDHVIFTDNGYTSFVGKRLI